MLSPKNQDNKNIAMLVFFSIIVLTICSSMLALSPAFFGYFTVVVILAFAFFYGGAFIHRLLLGKCPKCGGALYNMGVAMVFKSCFNVDTGKTFAAIGKAIYRCRDCENEFHRLIDYPYGPPATAYKYRYDYSKGYSKDGFHNVKMKKLPFKWITEKEYLEIRNNLIKEVQYHNTKNGFNKKCIRLKKYKN